jgi:hypothetical protein
LPANRAPRCIWPTALSFFAGEPRSYRESGVAVYLADRVVVVRIVGAKRAPRCIWPTALAFFAGEPRSYSEPGGAVHLFGARHGDA